MMSFVKIDRKAEHREVTIMYSVENVVVFYLKPHKCIALHQIMMFVSTSYDPFKKLVSSFSETDDFMKLCHIHTQGT